MEKIRIAQIGTSRYGHGNIIFKTLCNHPDFEVVGYTLPEGEREKFPEIMGVFEGYREMTLDEILSDVTIKVVAVETEEIYLTKYALMAARAGKHIQLEKPASPSLPDFEELIREVKKRGTILHTGYMYRYNPVIKDMLRRIREGELGEIISVEAQMSCRHGDKFTEWLPSLEGGMMFYLGCHLVDLIYTIQGKPLAVHTFNRTSGRFGVENSRDLAFAVLEYEKGISFVKTYAVECGGYDRRQLVITGTEGRFEIRPLEENVQYPYLKTKYNECKHEIFTGKPDEFESPIFDRYVDMLSGFARLLRGEEECQFTPDYELELFRLIKRCCE